MIVNLHNKETLENAALPPISSLLPKPEMLHYYLEIAPAEVHVRFHWCY